MTPPGAQGPCELVDDDAKLDGCWWRARNDWRWRRMGGSHGEVATDDEEAWGGAHRNRLNTSNAAPKKTMTMDDGGDRNSDGDG